MTETEKLRYVQKDPWAVPHLENPSEQVHAIHNLLWR